MLSLAEFQTEFIAKAPWDSMYKQYVNSLTTDLTDPSLVTARPFAADDPLHAGEEVDLAVKELAHATDQDRIAVTIGGAILKIAIAFAKASI